MAYFVPIRPKWLGVFVGRHYTLKANVFWGFFSGTFVNTCFRELKPATILVTPLFAILTNLVLTLAYSFHYLMETKDKTKKWGKKENVCVQSLWEDLQYRALDRTKDVSLGMQKRECVCARVLDKTGRCGAGAALITYKTNYIQNCSSEIS